MGNEVFGKKCLSLVFDASRDGFLWRITTYKFSIWEIQNHRMYKILFLYVSSNLTPDESILSFCCCHTYESCWIDSKLDTNIVRFWVCSVGKPWQKVGIIELEWCTFKFKTKKLKFRMKKLSCNLFLSIAVRFLSILVWLLLDCCSIN